MGAGSPWTVRSGVPSVFGFELLCSWSRKGEGGGCIWPKMKHFPFKSKTRTWLEGESLSSIIPGPEQSSNKPTISFLEERSQRKLLGRAGWRPQGHGSEVTCKARVCLLSGSMQICSVVPLAGLGRAGGVGEAPRGSLSVAPKSFPTFRVCVGPTHCAHHHTSCVWFHTGPPAAL